MDQIEECSADSGADQCVLDSKRDVDISSVKPLEDSGGSIKSTFSELVTSGSIKLSKMHRQLSRSLSNLDEFANKDFFCKTSVSGRRAENSSVLMQSSNSSSSDLIASDSTHRSLQQEHDLSLSTQNRQQSNYFGESSKIFPDMSSSFLTSIMPRHRQSGGMFMYTTGHMTKDIAKRKLIEPGHIIEKILKHTIPNVATLSISLVSCVSDSCSHSVHTTAYLTIKLVGEAEGNYRLNLKSYKINFSCAVKDRQSPALCKQPEEVFDFWEPGGQHTFPFKVGSPKNLKKLTSEMVTLECDVGVIPIEKYRISRTSDFVNISINNGSSTN